MRLHWLELRGFRCHEALAWQPDAGLNLLLGGNGTGKTSILEAIGYLATLASFRRSPDAALVGEGAGAALLRGEFSGAAGTIRVEVEIPREGRRRVQVDGKRAMGRAAVAARVALVAFLPDDLGLVKRGPAFRREFADDLAAQLWPAAATEHQEYERALRQRNALLRRDGRRADATTLGVWDDRLAALGAVVQQRRVRALGEVAGGVAALWDLLGGRGTGFYWQYHGAGLGRVTADEAAGAIRERLSAAVAAARDEDLERRTTTVGPHRDEIALFAQGRDLRTRASQGEQRTVALGLRLAAFDLLTERRGSAPVLLLDDVFSELDGPRREGLVARLPAGQVFLSSTHPEDVPAGGLRWAVAPGRVERMEGP